MIGHCALFKEKSKRNWHEIASEVSKENDPLKIAQLSHELNDSMLEEERRKAKERIERGVKAA